MVRLLKLRCGKKANHVLGGCMDKYNRFDRHAKEVLEVYKLCRQSFGMTTDKALKTTIEMVDVGICDKVNRK